MTGVAEMLSIASLANGLSRPVCTKWFAANHLTFDRHLEHYGYGPHVFKLTAQGMAEIQDKRYSAYKEQLGYQWSATPRTLPPPFDIHPHSDHNIPVITIAQVIAKWRRVALTERFAAQQHFLDLCELVGHPKPAEVDPTGDSFTFERGVEKDGANAVRSSTMVS